MQREQKRRENVSMAAAVLVVFSFIISFAVAVMVFYAINSLFGFDFFGLLDNGVFKVAIAAIAAYFLAPTYFDRTRD